MSHLNMDRLGATVLSCLPSAPTSSRGLFLSVPIAGLRLNKMCAAVHRVQARPTRDRPNGNGQAKSHTGLSKRMLLTLAKSHIFLHLRKQARAKGHTAEKSETTLDGSRGNLLSCHYFGGFSSVMSRLSGPLVFRAALCSIFALMASVVLFRPPARPCSVPAFW